MSNVSKKFSLDKKIVVVTGGSGLLGRTFSSAVAAAEGLVIVADRDILTAQQVAEEICTSYPNGAIAAEIDITCKQSVLRLIEYVHEQYGVIHAVVNNAYPRNSNYGRRVEDVTYEDFCYNLGVHAGGYFLIMQQFAQYFKSQGFGNIVNLSSIYGIMAPRFDIYQDTNMTMPVEYAATKAGIIHLTKYFAQYLKGTNIRINAISPGGIFNHQPETFLKNYRNYCSNKGMLDRSDLVGTLLFLLSDASLYLTGQNIVVDDGFSL
ncbi:oxidoreductase [Parvibium lacunae]|uniref:SDR family NAD(P)-dependent oxidoreductase n=1 Tax=Parvibium lacunae TaxID=1888893 RepID=A0A368L1J5_9BURK|nr:oxidoreductase [Parvibium lacunae]RCS57429.1 SDR family NAD(P)-dependent oxidoreductase [Parvibium lacunae]